MGGWNEDLVKRVLSRVLLQTPECDIKTFSRYRKRWVIQIDETKEYGEGHLDIRFGKESFTTSLRGAGDRYVFPPVKYKDIKEFFGFTPEKASEIETFDFKWLGKPEHKQSGRLYIG